MRRRRVTSWAVLLLREAPYSPCPHCARVTKTTTDGFCADCWGTKGGHRTPKTEPAPMPRWLAFLFRRWRRR